MFHESANEKVDVIYDGRGNWYKKMSSNDITPGVHQYYRDMTSVSPNTSRDHLYNPNSRKQQELENNVESYVASFQTNRPTYDILYNYAMSNFKAIHEYFSYSGNQDTNVHKQLTGHGFTVDPSKTMGTVYVPPRTVDQHTEYTMHQFRVSVKIGRNSGMPVTYVPPLNQFFYFNQAQVILALLAYLRLMNSQILYQ